MYKAREKKLAVKVGSVFIGSGHPVSIQSMTTTYTHKVPETVLQIKSLEAEGAELVRVAVPDQEALQALHPIKQQIGVPLIADVHFNFSLAMGVLDRPVDKLRINPGNIGGTEKFSKIVRKAKAQDIALRIGVNAGSLGQEVLQKWGGPTPEAMVEEALNYLEIVDKADFKKCILSLKAADVVTTIKAYKLISAKTEYPLHIGITEAGTPFRGTVKSAVGLGYLLLEGIGDTLRVSLSGPPEEEIRVAKEILQAAGLRQFGPEIISCPTCGRCGIDLVALVQEVEEKLKGLREPLKIAVMGCSVNGPGEARQADFGIAGGKGMGLIFKKGEVVKKTAEDTLVDTLIELIRETTNW
jgi:(E)-4-hydroxy-3-methylbut-2-enyl-diphosphate synthase